MNRHTLIKSLKWLIEMIDILIPLSIGVVCSILGFLGVTQSFLLTVTLGELTLLAFVTLRDRIQRENLKISVDKFSESIDSNRLDDTFKISIEDTPITADAEQEIWFVEETGTYSLQTKRSHIKYLLSKGGIVRFTVIEPEEAVLIQAAFRNGSSSSKIIKGRTAIFHDQITSLVDVLGPLTENLQVRFTPYILDNVFIFVDPSHPIESKRKGIVLHLGYHVPFDRRLGTIIQGNTSPNLFAYYYTQIYRIFVHATKVVLVAGASKSGKTTLLERLIDDIASDERPFIFFVLSKAVWKDNKHVGYEVVTSTDPIPRHFATLQHDGNYTIDSKIWTSVTNDLEQAYLKHKIIVIDEIGMLHFRDSNFLNTIETIINDPSTTLFATVPLDDHVSDFTNKIKLHYRSTVLKMRSDTRGQMEVEKVVKQELNASLYLVRRFHNAP